MIGIYPIRIVVILFLFINLIFVFNSQFSEFIPHQENMKTSYNNNGSENHRVNPKIMYMTRTTPIQISSYGDLVSFSSTGFGTKSQPFIIDGWNVTTNSGPCISVSTTDYYFIIRDNLFNGIDNSYDGVFLDHTVNGTIAFNEIYNCKNGLYADFARFNNLNGNSIYGNSEHGIYLASSSRFINITANDITANSLNGIYLSWSPFNNITDNTIYANIKTGIELDGLTTVDNTIGRNIIYNNTLHGIHARNNAERNKINENNLVSNQENGMRLENSPDNIIMSNNISNNYQDGILISTSNGNMLSGNEAHKNAWNGIKFVASDDVSVNGNIIFSNFQNGIWSDRSNHSSVNLNNVYNNSWAGIGVDSSMNNTFGSNVIYENDRGIAVYFSNDIEISENSVDNNGLTGILIYNTIDVTLEQNDIANNEDEGILLFESSNLNIQHNNLIDNVYDSSRPQINDTGSSNLIQYNYYDDWLAETNDSDGIVDSPYVFSGTASNSDPFPVCSAFNFSYFPPITNLDIIFPDGGEVFDDDDNILIQWTAPYDPLTRSVVYTLYYSSDNGFSWNILVGSWIETTFNWNSLSSLPKTSIYLIKVTGAIGGEINLESVSAGNFEMQSASKTTTTPPTTATTSTQGDGLFGTVEQVAGAAVAVISLVVGSYGFVRGVLPRFLRSRKQKEAIKKFKASKATEEEIIKIAEDSGISVAEFKKALKQEGYL
jgi:parallel beta-helix repeat protein